MKWLSSTWYDKFAEDSIEFYIKFQNLSTNTEDFICKIKESNLNNDTKKKLLNDKHKELETRD